VPTEFVQLRSHRIQRSATFCIVFATTCRNILHKKLSYRRGTARRTVSKFVQCFTSYVSYKGFNSMAAIAHTTCNL